MNRRAFSTYLGIGILCLSFSLAHVTYSVALTHLFNCWTDYKGTNHCGPDNPPILSHGKVEAYKLNEVGYRDYLHRQYQAAIDKYKKALVYDPDNSGIRQNLLNAEAAQAFTAGDKYFKERRYAKAIKKYNEALQYTPDDDSIRRRILKVQAIMRHPH